MAINFPNSPTINQQFEADGRIWKYNGSVWEFLGYPGPANDLTVGTVTTGNAGTDASVEITGNTPEQTINFTIPKGDQGIAGDDGIVVQATEPENTDILWVDTSEDGSTVNPITTEGDLIVGGASGVSERLPVGTDDQVLTVVAGVPEWADGGGGGGEKYWLLEPNTSNTIEIALTENLYYAVRHIGAEALLYRVYDSSDNIITSGTTFSDGFDKIFELSGTAAASIQVDNNSSSESWFVLSDPTSLIVDNSDTFYVITSTQSITLDSSYNAYVLGGGGAGGGASQAGGGGGGGGSGYYDTGTLTAGTYTATIGAGGTGSAGSDGGNGGTSSIGALSAAGGTGGGRVPSLYQGGAGGNGGSGGGGGAGGSGEYTNETAYSGFNGSSGATGEGTAPGVGGTGSSDEITIPANSLLISYIDPDTAGVSTAFSRGLGGQNYMGGGGGGITTTGTSGYNSSRYGGGGGGARGDTGSTNSAGGNGGSGVIVLVKVA